MSNKIVKSSWYQYPSVAARFEKENPYSIISATIGIVTVCDTETKEVKSYIGLAVGEDQKQDELHIVEYGVPFYD